MTNRKKNIIDLIFQAEANEILNAKEISRVLNNTKNIKSSGNQTEKSIRTFFKKMLPQKYYVGQGHIIDENLKTSPQIDIIISDNQKLPTLFKSSDETEIFPYESVFAIGEIKTTYYSSKKYFEEFSTCLKKVKESLKRTTVINSCYPEIKKDSFIQDIILGKKLKYLNYLYSFIVFIDSNDFQFDHIDDTINKINNKYLPDIIAFLDKGLILRGDLIDNKIAFNRQASLEEKTQNWIFCPFGSDKNRFSLNLSMLYQELLYNLVNSELSMIDLSKYNENIMKCKGSEMIFWQDDKKENQPETRNLQPATRNPKPETRSK